MKLPDNRHDAQCDFCGKRRSHAQDPNWRVLLESRYSEKYGNQGSRKRYDVCSTVCLEELFARVALEERLDIITDGTASVDNHLTGAAHEHKVFSFAGFK